MPVHQYLTLEPSKPRDPHSKPWVVLCLLRDVGGWIEYRLWPFTSIWLDGELCAQRFPGVRIEWVHKGAQLRTLASEQSQLSVIADAVECYMGNLGPLVFTDPVAEFRLRRALGEIEAIKEDAKKSVKMRPGLF